MTNYIHFVGNIVYCNLFNWELLSILQHSLNTEYSERWVSA